MTDEEALEYWEKIRKTFMEHYESEDSYWGRHHWMTSVQAVDAALSALRDRIALQNPQPLTLDELRKYKHGDPIYLVETEKPENTGWELWAADLPDGHPDTIAYGKTWFAYRTKPEPPEREANHAK